MNSITRIGSPFLHYDEIYNRVRWFVNRAVASTRQFEEILRETISFASQGTATRIILRILMPEHICQPLNEVAAREGFQFEVVIKLAGRWSGYRLAYVSRNHPSRNSKPEVLNAEDELVASVISKERYTRPGLADSLQRAGLKAERLVHPLSDEDKSRVLEIFREALPESTYLTGSRLDEMLRHPDHLVMVARTISDHRICSIVSTERLNLPVSLDDRQSRIFSISEITLVMKAGFLNKIKGVNGPLWLELIHHANAQGMDLLFCECRSALISVNSMCHRMGFNYCGRLLKHVVTGGEQNIDERNLDHHTPYRNLNVWAVNSAEIAAIDRTHGNHQDGDAPC